MALTKLTADLEIISALDNEPNDVGGLTTEQLKEKFDEAGNLIKEFINETLTVETDAHIADTENPHEVTKAQVGLGNADNTADADKPVSTAQQAELDLKANRLDVLEKTNATAYTPTGDYNPATKKYVDDTTAGVVLGQIPDGSISPVKLSSEMQKGVANGVASLDGAGKVPSGQLPQVGLLPRIIVTVDTGSVITCTDGTTTLTGTSTGSYTFEIPNYGTWSVTATLNGDTSFGKSVIVDTVKQYSITLKYIDLILNNNAWSDIHSVSADGANYWAVGDRKAVDLNGTVGTLAINGTYYVFILGFNHNSSVEGNGIHFGGFKTALSGGTDICLVDSKYSSTSTDGGKYFNMNHSSNTNAGGWKGCDLRYDILGSVNSKGAQNAATTTATSPVSNTLMAALPSDLRAVMQPMTKYSDNTGGGNDTASYVTTTVDYLPLLAEYEIFGTRSYANSAEKNYQTQYTYFINGNSKVKYKHNDTATSAYWWERSVHSTGTSDFCGVHTSGSASNRSAYNSLGISPAFKI